MNEKLLKRLGLKADASIEQIEAAIADMLDKVASLEADNANLSEAPPETDSAKLEKRITQKIAQSGGALNREQAVMAIAHQDEHGNKKKAAKK